jgi:hypothetical protein
LRRAEIKKAFAKELKDLYEGYIKANMKEGEVGIGIN